MQISSKLPNAGPSIFSTMSALAREYNAINLSQGFPDFHCSDKLVELATKYMKEGFNQYAPMPGVVQLRERISEILSMCYGAHYHPDSEITITAGATQAIYTALAAFIKQGDEVIVFEPAYDCYVPAIELHGGIAVYSSLNETNFSIEWADVRRKITPKTKAIIINSPHNPSGAILSAEDIIQLENIVKGTNIIVISDEVYEHMVFDENHHHSVAKNKTLKDQSILVSSFGKTIHTTGWKIGYIAASKEIAAEFRKIHQYTVFVVNHPLQLAIADYLGDKDNYLELRHFYQRKRDLFLKLTDSSKLIPLRCRGTYFQLMSYERISNEPDMDLAIRLTKEKKTGSNSIVRFLQPTDRPQTIKILFRKKR